MLTEGCDRITPIAAKSVEILLLCHCARLASQQAPMLTVERVTRTTVAGLSMKRDSVGGDDFEAPLHAEEADLHEVVGRGGDGRNDHEAAADEPHPRVLVRRV